MMLFEDKPIQDWTLAECKEYCENRIEKHTNRCDSLCKLVSSNICGSFFLPYTLNYPQIPQFTQDKIAFCRLIKKTEPWAHYLARSGFGNIYYMELEPKFDGKCFKSGTTGSLTMVDEDSFSQIVPMTYYAINDIIKQGE